MIKLTHIITTLDTGGAEMMLLKLLTRIDRATFSPEVISLTTCGGVGEKLQSLQLPVRALGMSRGVPNPYGMVKLAHWLRASRPDIVQTWMYHADLLGGLANSIATRAPLVWNIRHSNLEPELNKRTTMWAIHTCARLSRRLPRRIILNSEAARRNHQQIGYAADKMIVIPNGFDTEQFHPDAETRVAMRQGLQIPDEAFLIGMIARFDPQKDHRNFVLAAKTCLATSSRACFLLCGENVTLENRALRAWIADTGMPERFYLLGRRDDIPRVLTALDVCTSSSAGEGFPNAIGEAMASGVPCVVTEAGDSALLVAETGKSVPVKNPEALARAWRELETIGSDARQALGQAARSRIERNFSLPAIVARYEQLYRELAPCAA